MENIQRIAILGGGPSGLFMFKRLVEAGRTDLHIDVYEKKRQLGTGMPYSTEGANDEHVTNVSGNEIPLIVTPIAEWIKTAPQETLDRFCIDPENFSDYKVLPRLLFGQYLAAQFDLLQQKADEAGISYAVHCGHTVTDIINHPDHAEVEINGETKVTYNKVIICTGHRWPAKHEGRIGGYFDSPYPPAKLALKLDHPVAIKGSSLTAVDAVRTLALNNGTFTRENDGMLSYQLHPECAGFKMILHTRNGMLPAVRFHLQDSHLENDALLSHEEVDAHIAANGGFLSLDFIFEKDFKEIFKAQRPEFYQRIKDMSMEEFVADMMALREDLDPFVLLKAEYVEAGRSIKRHESVYWKEMLGVLSFAMNYPAKHLSAEDMLRLQKTLLPLISIVIAYVPQSSCQQLLALHNAGLLDIIPVGEDSHVEAEDSGGATYHYTDEEGEAKAVYFKTFIDCVGQPHLSYEDLPFKSLVDKNAVTPARLQFRSADEAELAIEKGNEHVKQDTDGDYYMHVPGIAINDNFQVIDNWGAYNDHLYMMAVPYIGGYNPDYSGLDFCEEASGIIIKAIQATL